MRLIHIVELRCGICCAREVCMLCVFCVCVYVFVHKRCWRAGAFNWNEGALFCQCLYAHVWLCCCRRCPLSSSSCLIRNSFLCALLRPRLESTTKPGTRVVWMRSVENLYFPKSIWYWLLHTSIFRYVFGFTGQSNCYLWPITVRKYDALLSLKTLLITLITINRKPVQNPRKLL